MNSTSILRRLTPWLCLVSLFTASLAPDLGAANEQKGAWYSIGAAKVDITPDFPVLMNGYFYRTNESTGVAQRIFAKALAIGTDAEGPAILISADNCGMTRALREELLKRLQKKGITSDKLAICVSHSHTAPKLAGNIDNIFGRDIPLEHQAHIDRYTKEFLNNLEKVALAALKNRRPAKLSWGQTTVEFAINRRVPNGPVDHDLPVLKVTAKSGKTIALVANYACHCTTLSTDNTDICGDWAGYAQEAMEQAFPGAIAMTTIGCGAECNPSPAAKAAPATRLDQAKAHGRSLASAAAALAPKGLTPISEKLECRSKQLQLLFSPLPTRKELEALAKQTDPYPQVAYHARKNLARLDRGEKLPGELPYLIQTWNFGKQLAMVFLAGEVVGDYSLRLKEELDGSRLWVTAYANDVPCYIPSLRVWKQHGYEADFSMVYYDLPTRLNENTENKIIGAVHELMPREFAAKAKEKSAAEKEKLRVYLLMGQSNMVGRGLVEGQDRSAHSRVFLFTPSNHWDLAVEPLHGSSLRGGIGPGLVFAKAMATQDTNVNIGLIPTAVGATLLQRWERGGDLYSNAVARARVAMRDGTLTGILWHQGEQDSILETDANSYHDRIVKMIGDIRTELGQPNLPFVVGQIGEFLYTRKVQQTPFAKTVNDALARIPGEIPFTACVLATGLTHDGDEVHFDNKAQRELGKRYAVEMQKLVGTVTPEKNGASLDSGFMPLFDGKSLSGWHYAAKTGGYYATNGVLVCTPRGGDLFTDREYSDFILRMEFKLTPGGNNGIAIRAVAERPGAPSPKNEIQILDDNARQHAKLDPSQYCGSLYKIFPAKRGHTKTPGEWNSLQITASGARIEVVLNGVKIVEGNLDDVRDPHLLEGHPGLKRPKGHIGFLGHRTPVEFRKITVREL